MFVLWRRQRAYHKDVPSHDSEVERNCRSLNTTESAEVGSAYRFVLLSLHLGVCTQSIACGLYRFGKPFSSFLGPAPPPPPLAPTLVRSQQPEGHQHAQQQRDFLEASEALCPSPSTSTKEYRTLAHLCFSRHFYFLV